MGVSSRDMLRKRVDASKDFLVKARYFKSIGDMDQARKWAGEECNKRLRGGHYNSAVGLKREFELPYSTLAKSVDQVYQMMMKSEKFEVAARTGKEFGMPEEKFVDAAMAGFQRQLVR